MKTMPAFWLRLACLILTLCPAQAARAQELNENCTISVLNRNVRVKEDGSWVLPNIPANFGPVRARVTCIIDGLTVSGESEPFVVPPNGAVNVPKIMFGHTTPIPTTMTMDAPTRTLTTVGATVQLAVVGHYAAGVTQDLAAASAGTRYTISNRATATVSADGVVQALKSGTVLVQATNEGASGMIAIQIAFSNADSDGDGIPDEWEVARGLNPNNALDAQEDPDHDGLTSLKEYHLGTDPQKRDTDADGLSDGDEVNVYHTNPLLRDTDGDGIGDGLEVQAGTDPLNSGSSNLAAALASLRVTPNHFILTFNTIAGDVSRFLTVTGVMKDGATIDLTQTARGTNYASSDLTICNFGEDSGRVYAGTSGTCTITITNSALTTAVNGEVRTFSPTPLSVLPIPGYANAVAVNGTIAYVAAGEAGLQVIDVADRAAPAIVAALDTPGNSNDVKLAGARAYVADGRSGLQIIDVANPLAPRLLGTLDTPGVASALVVAGDLVYLAAGDGGLQIIDAHTAGAPRLISSLHLPSAANGVDVRGTIVTVSTDYSGLQFVDVADVNHPVLVGAAELANQTRGVVTRGTTAYVADYTTGMVMLDVSDPRAPSFLSFVGQGGGVGWLTGIAVADRYAAGSDIFFLSQVAIVDVRAPANPIPRAVLDFRVFGIGFSGVGLTMDSNFVYLVEAQSSGDKGVSAPSRLVIGQYRGLEDQNDVPPAATIVSPAADAAYVAGEPIPVVVNAVDDVAVTAVDIHVDGVPVFHDTSDPFEFSVIPAAGATSVTIGATAADLGGNGATAADVRVTIVPDPLTTVRGRVVDANGQPFAGATASIQSFSTTTGADGRFTIGGVATIARSVAVSVTIRVNGVEIVGTSAGKAPVRSGVTDVGDIIVSSAFVTDLGTRLACVGFCVDLPFDFTIGGNTYRQLAVNQNGSVSFPGGDIIDVALLNLFEIAQDPTSGVFVNNASPDHVVVTWNRMVVADYCCAFPGPESPRDTLQLILFKDGLIQFGFRGVEPGYATVGVFPVGASVFTAIDFGATPNVTIRDGEAVYENFDLADNTFDLDGAIISFAPAAGGGYSIGVAADTTPPVCTVTSPASGVTVLEGQTVPIRATATDGSTIRRVRFDSGTGIVDDIATPYGASFVVPIGVGQVTFSVTAFDGAGNSGLCSATVTVIPDPLTTAVGRVVDKTQAPVAGVNVIVLGQSGTTGADGTFSLTGVHTVEPSLIANATLFEDGTGRILLTGSSAPQPPVRSGTTNLGDIVVAATAFETDLGTQITCDFSCTITAPLPFDFPMAGAPHNQVYIRGREGIVNTDDGGYIVPLCCAMDANPADPASGLYVNDRLPGRFVVTWFRTFTNDIEHPSNTVQLILFADGRVQYGYRELARGSYGVELIPPNTYSLPLGADFSAGIPATIGPGQSVGESFSDTKLLDLANGFVVFTPRADGGYDLRSVSDAAPPICTVTSPVNGSTVFEGELIEVRASVTPRGAAVGNLHVQSSDGSLMRDWYEPPYTTTFVVPSGAGPRSFDVTAFDGWNHTGFCTSTVNVVSGPPPTVTILSPAEGATLTAGATVSIRVQASSRVPVRRFDGSVNGVPLFSHTVNRFERVPLGDPQIVQFAFTVPAGVGSFTVAASAVDSVGKTGASEAATFTVAADPRTTVRGRVADQSDAPMSGARVTANVRHGLTADVFNFSNPLSEMPDITGRIPDLTTIVPSLNLRNPGLTLGSDPFGLGTAPARVVRFTASLQLGLFSCDCIFTLGINQGAVLMLNGRPVLNVSPEAGAYQEVRSQEIRFKGAASIELLTYDSGNLDVQLSYEVDGTGMPIQLVPASAFVPARNSYQTTSAADGMFSIANLPTTLGDISVTATLPPSGGVVRSGLAGPLAPVANGITDASTIRLSAAPVVYTIATDTGTVLRLDTITGQAQMMAPAGSLRGAQGLTVLRSGKIAVTLGASVTVLDPAAPIDHNLTVISSGGLLQLPSLIAEAPDGTLVIHDAYGALIRVDPAQPSPGNQSLIPSDPSAAVALVIEPNGSIVTGDHYGYELVRIDPQTGLQTPVPGSTGCPYSAAREANGNLIYVGNPFCGSALYRLTPEGERTTFQSGDPLYYPLSVAVAASGDILVMDQYSGLVRVNPLTGEATLAFSQMLLGNIGGVAVAPPQ